MELFLLLYLIPSFFLCSWRSLSLNRCWTTPTRPLGPDSVDPTPSFTSDSVLQSSAPHDTLTETLQDVRITLLDLRMSVTGTSQTLDWSSDLDDSPAGGTEVREGVFKEGWTIGSTRKLIVIRKKRSLGSCPEKGRENGFLPQV